ncbi:hypothetical protein VNO78_15908 [Psophocarpus tetragonolobus]|uniref:Uncharacterized protein n=1 Tax=Psophocarpus tetragonolobus TaxID=3891 RepID=A0AAN9SFE3_PSOTE
MKRRCKVEEEPRRKRRSRVEEERGTKRHRRVEEKQRTKERIGLTKKEIENTDDYDTISMTIGLSVDREGPE